MGGDVVFDDRPQHRQLPVVKHGLTSLALCVPECQVYGHRSQGCDNTAGTGRNKPTANTSQVGYPTMSPMTAPYGQTLWPAAPPLLRRPPVSLRRSAHPRAPSARRVLWIVLLLGVLPRHARDRRPCIFAGVSSTIANIGEIAPKTTFTGGETVKVALNPADSPAIWAAAGQPTDVSCQVTGADASQKITLDKAVGTQTLTYDGTKWEMLVHDRRPGVRSVPGRPVTARASKFGVGKQLPVGRGRRGAERSGGRAGRADPRARFRISCSP